MVKISKIGDALNRINDATFQELCNKFLKYKYDFKTIIQTGSVIGKEKTRKGTPDTIFIDSFDNYIFVEYTTEKRKGNSKSFINKIKSDINKCFDTKKTQIDNHKISKVIICHTEKLTLSEIEELTSLCQSYNPVCIFEQYGIDDLSLQLEMYPSLLSTYLDIKIGSGQIMQLPEYINFYEKPDLKIATPLSNTFYGRTDELKKGLFLLTSNNLLLITGSSGVGKSRFAIELCKEFLNNNSSYSLLCYANKNVQVYDDLQTQLLADKDYILLVDDANRVMANYNFILLLLRSDRKGRIKVITTVRDYAVDLIERESGEYNYETLSLDVVTKEDINTILKSSDFNIQNEDYLEKINLIARGNLRIAIMCAIIAIRERSLSSLDDVSQLYEHYFSDIYQKILSLDKENSLKVLGIISFFRVISKERKELNEKIFSVFSINEHLFWEQCQKLNQNEIVDLYENEIVKISDQILSTYILYKAFFIEKVLDFSLLISNFIDHDSKFYDSLNPLIVAFNQKDITSELTVMIERGWIILTKNNEYHQILKIGNIFWFCLGNRLLSYFYNYINLLPEPENKYFTADYEHNEISMSGRTHLLGILSKFKRFYDERALSAIELMFLYVEKEPDQSKRLSFLLTEEWMITRYDYDLELYPQHLLIDFLINKVKEDPSNSLYTKFFFKMASNLLETTFRENVSEGNQLTMYTINITLTDSIKKIRQKIWEFAWSLYPLNVNSFHKLLFDLGRKSYQDANDIWLFDYEIITPYLKQIDYSDYKACEATANFLNRLKWANIIYDKSIEKIATNRLFELNKLLIDRDDDDNWRENESRKKQELLEYFKNYKYEDYIGLFNDIESLKALKKENNNDYFFPVSIIFSGIISRDNDLFVRLLIYYIEHYTTSLWSNSLLNEYFASCPTNYIHLYNCLLNCKTDRAKLWVLEFHYAIPKEYVDNNEYLLLNFYDILPEVKTSISRINEIVEKYQIYESKIKICNNILDSLSVSNQLYIDEKSLSYLLDVTDDYITCQDVYIRCRQNEKYFDFKQELFVRLLQLNSNFFIKYLSLIYKDNNSIHTHASEKYTVIWQLDNYEELVLSAIDYFIANKIRLYSRDLPMMFFNGLGEHNNNALSLIENMISQHYNNIDYIEVIFNVISHCYPQDRCQFIKQLLLLNQDFEFFQKIDLFPRSMTATGSWIPVYERRTKDWENILNTVKSLNMGIKLINHINYIENQINSYKARIKNEAKRDFLERYDSY